MLTYPQSHDTMLQVRKALDKCNWLKRLGKSLQNSIRNRLLIPGVITQTIINQYINTLKVLQIIDTQGIIYQLITSDIKNYLLKRQDTLRCIISLLTQDGQNYVKLVGEVVRVPRNNQIVDQSDDQKHQRWKQRSGKVKDRLKYQQSDLVSVLVGLYGSQEAFINQYQNMLAQKLLGAKQISLQQQTKNIQLLKLRFGESSLQVSNIIIKDVKDSRRHDRLVHLAQQTQKKTQYLPFQCLHCLSVSKGYWPISYQTKGVQIPKIYQDTFQKYSQGFSKIKAMRRLVWHFQLGYARIVLTFDNGPFQFRCLPIHATLISLFDQSANPNGLSSDNLADMLQLNIIYVKQKISYWIHKGVIKQHKQSTDNLKSNVPLLRKLTSTEGDTDISYYRVVKIYQKNSDQDVQFEQQQNQLIKVSGNLLQSRKLVNQLQHIMINILINHGPKTGQKIQQLLKTVYKGDIQFAFNQSQIKQILKSLLSKKKIQFNGEIYSAVF